MGKQLMKSVGLSAIEKTLQALLPDLIQKLTSLQTDIRDLRRDVDLKFAKVDLQFAKVDEQFANVHDQFDRTQSLINELGLRINTVDTRVVDFKELVRDTSSKMDDFRERLVRVEISQAGRRKRAS